MWDQQSLIFKGPLITGFSTDFKPSNLRNSQLWLTSTQVWRLLHELELSHTAHTVPCITWSFHTLGEGGTGAAGSQPQVNHRLSFHGTRCFGVFFFTRMGRSTILCWTLISFQYPSALSYLQNIYLEENWRGCMSKHHKARSWWFQRRKWKSLL